MFHVNESFLHCHPDQIGTLLQVQAPWFCHRKRVTKLIDTVVKVVQLIRECGNRFVTEKTGDLNPMLYVLASCQ